MHLLDEATVGVLLFMRLGYFIGVVGHDPYVLLQLSVFFFGLVF